MNGMVNDLTIKNLEKEGKDYNNCLEILVCVCVCWGGVRRAGETGPLPP